MRASRIAQLADPRLPALSRAASGGTRLDGQPHSSRLHYDLAGRLTAIDYPSSTGTVTRGYDAADPSA